MMEDLFQVKTIRQRKIMEWLTAQNVTREDASVWYADRRRRWKRSIRR